MVAHLKVTTHLGEDVNNYTEPESRERIKLTLACWTDKTEVQTDVGYFLGTRNVADIFYLNSIKTALMENAGEFANLYSLMEAGENFNNDDYLMNILAPFEQDGLLYEFFKYFQIKSKCTVKKVEYSFFIAIQI